MIVHNDLDNMAHLVLLTFQAEYVFPLFLRATSSH